MLTEAERHRMQVGRRRGRIGRGDGRGKIQVEGEGKLYNGGYNGGHVVGRKWRDRVEG